MHDQDEGPQKILRMRTMASLEKFPERKLENVEYCASMQEKSLHLHALWIEEPEKVHDSLGFSLKLVVGNESCCNYVQ
jgi:hypothetical protein